MIIWSLYMIPPDFMFIFFPVHHENEIYSTYIDRRYEMQIFLMKFGFVSICKRDSKFIINRKLILMATISYSSVRTIRIMNCRYCMRSKWSGSRAPLKYIRRAVWGSTLSPRGVQRYRYTSCKKYPTTLVDIGDTEFDSIHLLSPKGYTREEP
jgi:hypothetical protein